MKHMNRIFALVLVLIMVLGLATTAFAAGTGTITITPPEGVSADAVNTYKIYKVFDAVASGDNISYTLVSGKTDAPAGFKVDENGNVTYAGGPDVKDLTANDIAAIAEYVTETDLVDTVTATGSTDVTSKALDNGYYYITTTTGSVVTIDSTKPNAEVIDKNRVPELGKKITGASSVDENGEKALAQIGTSVNYEVTIKVEAGAVGYEFHDQMGAGLKYNSDVKVYIDNAEIDVANYDKTTADGDTITINFDNTWIKTVIDKTIVVKYSATITSDALQTDPAKNTAWLEYGEKNRTVSRETEVYNAKFAVTKQDGAKNPLAGAGFVLKNADGKYYKYTAATDTTAAKVEWVDKLDDATEYTSDENGAVPAFVGLANGTYTLVEKTVPAGYNKAADSTFTIAEHDYTTTNLEQGATVTNNAGTELPSTGGMGTTLFYVIGGLLVAAAVVLLVSKKRMTSAE